MIHRYVQRDARKKISEESLLRLIREPIVTEKAFSAQAGNQYFFKVAMWANKIQIKKSIEHVFSVEVESVNTLVVKGKFKRFRGRMGQRKDYKKAMVFLKPGHKISVQEEAGL